ncbi:MAG: hypothetical protein KAS73_02050, partial [Candidatus Sabulitectum sp.]|nr:hypothetical protein [Candidatus Sabulitectum sp.]
MNWRMSFSILILLAGFAAADDTAQINLLRGALLEGQVTESEINLSSAHETAESSIENGIFIEEFAVETDADYYFECDTEGSFITSPISWPGGIGQNGSYLSVVEAGGENEVHIYRTTGSRVTGFDGPAGVPIYGVMSTGGNYYVNCDEDTSPRVYTSSNGGSSWSPLGSAPTGYHGRGMSYDGDVTHHIFEAVDSKIVVHWAPSAGTASGWNLSSYIGGSFITGVAVCDASDVFPDVGISGTAIVVCARGSDDLWLFVRQSSGNLSYIGSCDMPGVSTNYNQGITYHESTGKFYLVNNSSGTTRVYRLDLSAGIEPSNPPAISRVNPSSSTATIVAGESINFQVSATDQDGDLDRFEWDLNGLKVAENPASGSSAIDNWSKTFTSPGTYTVKASVFDEDGNDDFLQWTVLVEEPSTPPEIFRDNPTSEDVYIYIGESITFEVNATDDNGDLEYFEWLIDGMPMVTHPVSGASASDSWVNDFTEAGTFQITSAIYDSDSNTDQLDWNIHVEDPAPEIFRDNPITEFVSIYIGESIDFEVHATDENSDLDHFVWFLNGDWVAENSASGGYDDDSWFNIFNETGSYQVDSYIYDAQGNEDQIGWQVEVTLSDIIINEPNSSTSWTHFDTNLSITWEYPAILAGDNVSIALYDGGTLVETLVVSTVNDGSWIYAGPVPMSWTPGTQYQIKIVDDLGNFGWSENFEIVPSENAEVITVTEPDVSTIWEHFETDLPVNWSYPALLRILSGENVSIALYDGGTLVETLVASTDNDGSWTYAGPVPMSWIPGIQYQIKIVDDLGNFGWSENFEIVPSENAEVITVTEPDVSTIWTHFDTDLPVSWEYPALLGSASVFGALSGDNVSIALYDGSTLVETLVASTDNDGSWTYAGPVPKSWTPGTQYSVKIVDDLGNFGW